jgi:hypothetical protein
MGFTSDRFGEIFNLLGGAGQRLLSWLQPWLTSISCDIIFNAGFISTQFKVGKIEGPVWQTISSDLPIDC